jgi:hypothetical protein
MHGSILSLSRVTKLLHPSNVTDSAAACSYLSFPKSPVFGMLGRGRPVSENQILRELRREQEWNYFVGTLVATVSNARYGQERAIGQTVNQFVDSSILKKYWSGSPSLPGARFEISLLTERESSVACEETTYEDRNA